MFWFFVLFVVIVTPYIIKYIKFKKSDYSSESGNTFFHTINDKGDYGEYLTFSALEKLEGYNIVLTNLYLPKKDGTTTEVDVVMISKTGIYAFESKNYSGWIYGDEKNKNWTQTLEKGRKYQFFNPIWQNGGHITGLKDVLKLDNKKAYKSYIVFSERCELKDITVTSDVKVIKRNDLISTIKNDIDSSPDIFTVKEINRICAMLQKYTLVDESVKKEHIKNIEKKLK